jgi:small nuclear ribonucleoprotein (snRNP)-like protein
VNFGDRVSDSQAKHLRPVRYIRDHCVEIRQDDLDLFAVGTSLVGVSGMPTGKTPKDLTVLLQALASSYILTIETRSGTIVCGVLESVDKNMNVTMSQVTINAGSETFPSLFLSGRHIVFVHLPEDVDIRDQIDSYERRNRT